MWILFCIYFGVLSGLGFMFGVISGCGFGLCLIGVFVLIWSLQVENANEEKVQLENVYNRCICFYVEFARGKCKRGKG